MTTDPKQVVARELPVDETELLEGVAEFAAHEHEQLIEGGASGQCANHSLLHAKHRLVDVALRTRHRAGHRPRSRHVGAVAAVLCACATKPRHSGYSSSSEYSMSYTKMKRMRRTLMLTVITAFAKVVE